MFWRFNFQKTKTFKTIQLSNSAKILYLWNRLNLQHTKDFEV